MNFGQSRLCLLEQAAVVFFLLNEAHENLGVSLDLLLVGVPVLA